MSEHIQKPIFGHCYMDNASKPVCTLLDHCRNDLLPLITPEDTTEQPDTKRHAKAVDHGNFFQGAVKAWLWLAASIGLALLIGQLH